LTENTAPSAETFNLSDWLTGGSEHRPTRSVTVYRDLHLSAELDRIRAEIARYEAQTPVNSEGVTEKLLGEAAGTTEMHTRAEEILAKIRSVKVDLTVRGLIRPELLVIEEHHEPGTPAYEYEVFAKAVEFPGDQHLTPAQWAQFHEVIGQGQFNRVVQTYQAAQNTVPEVDAPFSPPASRRGNTR
jgi:hypothetical protein